MQSRSVLRSGFQPGNRKICFTVIVLAVIIGSVLLAYTAFGDKPKDASLKKVFIVSIYDAILRHFEPHIDVDMIIFYGCQSFPSFFLKNSFAHLHMHCA